MNTDEDYEFALQLQAQFFQEDQPRTQVARVSPVKKRKIDSPKKSSLVDPEWEITDPNPDIFLLFSLFNKRFFWNKLGAVEVKWSPRMTSCAGICTYKGLRGCTVSLSLPLLKLRPRKDLVETLLHEMIHAYLFITHNNKDRDGHGPEFHKHMYRINGEAGTNISVYHTFHDEVRHYQNHVWRCDGPCRARPPFYGILRRAMNRAPGPNDFWFESHRLTCGGTYHKVSEPEKFQGKKKQLDSQQFPQKNKGKLQNITNFPSKPSNQISNGLNTPKKKPVLKVSPTTPSSQSKIKKFFGGAMSSQASNGSSPSNSLGGRSEGGPGQNRFSNSGRLGGSIPSRSSISNSSLSVPKTGDAGNRFNSSGGRSNDSSGGSAKATKIPKGGAANRPTSFSSPAGRGSSGFRTIGSSSSNINGFGSNHNGGGSIVSHGGSVNNVHGFTNLSRPGGSSSSDFHSAKGRGGTVMRNRGGTVLEKPKMGNNKTNDESVPSASNVQPFSGTGYTLSSGPSNRSKSKLLDMFPPPKKKEEPSTSVESDTFICDPHSSNHSFRCPVCNKPIDQNKINEHLDECTSLESVMSATETIVIEDSDDEEDVGASGSTVNCPNCSYKGPESSINEHLDLCLSMDYDAFESDHTL